MIIIPFLNGYFIWNIPNIFRQTHMFKLPKTEEISERNVTTFDEWIWFFSGKLMPETRVPTFKYRDSCKCSHRPIFGISGKLQMPKSVCKASGEWIIPPKKGRTCGIVPQSRLAFGFLADKIWETGIVAESNMNLSRE